MKVIKGGRDMVDLNRSCNHSRFKDFGVKKKSVVAAVDATENASVNPFNQSVGPWYKPEAV